MKSNVLNSPRLLELKRKRRRVLEKKILFFLLGFLILVSGLVFVSRLEKLNISETNIIGNKVLDSKMIETVVKKDTQGYYLWLFPKTNFLLYPENQIRADLSNQFKIIKDVSLVINNIKTLEISLIEREAKYIWCGDNFPAEKNQCYFMDNTGYIFDEAPYFSGNVYFKFFGKIQYFDKLISLKENMEKMGLAPILVFYKDTGDVNINLSSGAEIRFKSDSNFNKVAENLQTALSTEPLQTDFKKKYSLLLYIDLRFGNKVYYKFQ